jgi:pimeloyl-ACP methyl ester carboxylesterase
MATYVLIHGASSDAWHWHRVVPLLEARGHEVIAPDLPSDDDAAGWDEYAGAVVRAIGDRPRAELVVVAQSLGGFTGPIVCDRVKADLLVLVAAMVPAPGESGDAWWKNTEFREAKRENDVREGRPADAPFDVREIFFHDVPPDVVGAAMRHGVRAQSATAMHQPWPLRAWPAVPTRFLLCRNDRFFPAAFQRRVVKERLGLVPDEMESGHLPALAHPESLVERLEAYRTTRPR